MADSGTAAVTESSLLSKLESSSDLAGIHQLFLSYLQPFSPVLKKQSTKSLKTDATTLRPLAKKFLSFLNKSLSLLPKRLTETPKIDCHYASELFDTYKLCLNCLDAISSQLSCKPHTLQIQRVRLITCYGNWGRHEDVQSEGVSVLGFIGNLSGKRIGNLNERIVPELRKEIDDKDIALLILEVVVSLVKCLANSQSKEEGYYYRVLSMVDEIQPWLRVIGADGYDKLHRLLVSYMSKCALFLAGELSNFDLKLTCKFCVGTFSEYKRSSLNDQIEKFALKICSSVFSQLDDEIVYSEKVLTLVLDTMAKECAVGKEKANADFLELVVYFAMKCRNATADFCGAVASHFKKLANYFSQVNLSMIDLILRLYAITFSMGDLNYNSRDCNSKAPKAGISILKLLLDVENQLQSLRISITVHTGTYMSFYFDALKFLCEPLSELIQSERKDILCGFDDMSFLIKLSNIEDIFQQFRLVFEAYCKFKKEKYVYEDNSRAVLAVATAAFTLSFTTKKYFEKSTTYLKELVSTRWIQANGLKYLYASLHNVGIVLYRDNRLKEATKSFDLSCQAAWKCVMNFCKTLVSSEDESLSDLSEDAIMAFVTETYAKSAFLLDILYQCGTGSKEISMILIDFLESWSAAQKWFDKIPIPVALVKQWVKILCKETKDPEDGCSAPIIYSLMSSSLKMSKETLGFLLEQELEAYRELRYLNPELCKIMQMVIPNILLKDIYSTKDSFLHKSRILIAKGRESRACGIEGLNECIDFLSEAISTMSDMENKDKETCGSVCNLLAEAYCLRALCTQEAEPNSKFFVQDIGYALKLWLSQEHSQCVEQSDMVYHNILNLLYRVADLLSLKGYMDAHPDIYELMIRFCTCKHVSLKECLAMLWQTKSLSHALCTSHVDDAFILTFSKHCKLSNSLEFWKSCMEKSKSLEVSFQQCFSVNSTLSFPSSCNHDHAAEYASLTIDDIKKTAFDLSNSVPVSSKSLFLSSNLYHDLSGRMISKGSMIEALLYAKEAHKLRTKLFKNNFLYLIEKHNDISGDNGEVIQKCGYELKSFHVQPSVATGAWSNDKSSDFEFILTPWNVLRCYLESILQVGTLEEIVGNGSEAEALFLWGKKISSFQHLPIFSVSFSTALGKLYRKQKCWHLAEKELESANHMLVDSFSLISCLKCKLILEVIVGKQLGDLFRSRYNNSDDNKPDGLSKAEIFYKSVVEKLKHSDWKNCVSNPKETISRNTMFCDRFLVGGNDVVISSDCGNHGEQEAIQPKVTRKGKKTATNPPQEQRLTSRITRSSKQKNENNQNELKRTQKSDGYCIVSCGCEVTCVSDEVNCWHCVPFGVMKSASLASVIQMKWECTRRRLLVKLLIGIGKCLWARGETQRAHEVFLESISALVNRSTFHPSKFKISFSFLGELITKNVIGDLFVIEHAMMLYNICWFSLRSSYDYDMRNYSCDMSFIPIPIVVSGLKQSFTASREVPELSQKVSRLLAVLYTLSPSNKTFSMLASSSNLLSDSQWASYFHQASLGTHVNSQLFPRLGKQKDQNTMDADGSFPSSSTSPSCHRLAPESVLDLEEFILNFFQGLPRTTIICISILGNEYASWLRYLLPCKPANSWIMFSRLDSDCAPIVIILPIASILAGSTDDEDSSCDILFKKKSSDKSWHCPWGHTVVDEIAPLFRTILEESYLSSSGYSTLEDTKQNRSIWWNQRRKLDQRLGDLLRNMEDLWFGPWKHLLLGGLSGHKNIDFLPKKLRKDLKSKCKIDVHENIIKAVIKGGGQQEECLSELIMKKGCYIGEVECIDDGSLSCLVSDLLLNTMHEIEEDSVDREPVILVLDLDIQMLPWENLPVLRNQEVYRMPSVASISYTYDRRCYHEKDRKDSSLFPMIDPLDAYYLLNPGGDLSNTEAEFGDWFKEQNLEGTAGTSPSVDELSTALKNHDLFIYLGHGSGVQYIPGGEIQKLEQCAATLLMGCSSGSLSLNGSYTPKGAPLYYLFAGSPVIIANLWDVTDKDIDRFCKTVLDGWIKARSNTSVDCAQCTKLSDKFENMSITDGGTRKGKKKLLRSKSVEDCEVTIGCKHRPKVGSFMGQARQACTLPFLIGAAPVCYGVPTGILKKDL